MNKEEIRNIVRSKGNTYIFGPLEHADKGNYEGMAYIEYNSKDKKIKFTSDTMDYTMAGKMEEVLEMLFREFHTNNIDIHMHIHPGDDHHDKDVTLELNHQFNEDLVREVPELIHYLMDNFYKVVAWDFRVE